MSVLQLLKLVALFHVTNFLLTNLFLLNLANIRGSLESKGPFTLCVFMHLCLQFDANAKNGFYTHLTQHPIDIMLQFDANTHAHANVDASVNGP